MRCRLEEGFMGFAPLHTFAAALTLALAGSVVLAGAAEAQQSRQNQRPRVTITKDQSFLHPGTMVKPGSRPYQNYAFPPGYNFPTFSPSAAEPGPITGLRWPLPGPFDLPGF